MGILQGVKYVKGILGKALSKTPINLDLISIESFLYCGILLDLEKLSYGFVKIFKVHSKT